MAFKDQVIKQIKAELTKLVQADDEYTASANKNCTAEKVYTQKVDDIRRKINNKLIIINLTLTVKEAIHLKNEEPIHECIEHIVGEYEQATNKGKDYTEEELAAIREEWTKLAYQIRDEYQVFLKTELQKVDPSNHKKFLDDQLAKVKKEDEKLLSQANERLKKANYKCDKRVKKYYDVSNETYFVNHQNIENKRNQIKELVAKKFTDQVTKRVILNNAKKKNIFNGIDLNKIYTTLPLGLKIKMFVKSFFIKSKKTITSTPINRTNSEVKIIQKLGGAEEAQSSFQQYKQNKEVKFWLDDELASLWKNAFNALSNEKLFENLLTLHKKVLKSMLEQNLQEKDIPDVYSELYNTLKSSVCEKSESLAAKLPTLIASFENYQNTLTRTIKDPEFKEFKDMIEKCHDLKTVLLNLIPNVAQKYKKDEIKNSSTLDIARDYFKKDLDKAVKDQDRSKLMTVRSLAASSVIKPRN